MFCPTCKSLMMRRTARGRTTSYCPQCDGIGTPAAPQAWFTKKADGPERSSAAARAAVTAQPVVPTGGKRAKPRGGGEPREPKVLPPPEKLDLAPGMDLFPFREIRDGQKEFVADVKQAAEEKRHLLAHAPTGLGKTVSTLAPLVQYALKHQKRVFFLTSKQSQHKIAVDTLKSIRDKAGVPIVVADVIGKQDMCPRREARELYPKRFSEFCRREQVSKSCEYWETANQGALRMLKSRVHHVEELVITSTDETVCPHQAAMDLAAQAHVVVCDYNHLFSDMRAGVQERMKVELGDVLLVVDEAHNLPDRIRDHLTLRLDEYVLNECIEELKDIGDNALARVLIAVGEVLADLAAIEPPVHEDDRAPRGERYVTREELIEAFDQRFARRSGTLMAVTYDQLVEMVMAAGEKFLKDYKTEARGLERLFEFFTNWKVERRGIARILTREPTPVLAYKILDPAVLAKPVFDAVHCSVVMSGTLHPMAMMRDVLGIPAERAMLREYESPFPRENRLVLVDASVTTGYKERTPAMFRDIGARLAAIAIATPGNVAAFFPSYGILEQVRDHVEAGLNGRKDLIVEERGLDKSEKEALVGQMRRGIDNALLLGVQGGSLSEGYDYADNLLKGVVIVGLPFAAPSLEVESLIGYYDKKFGPGYGRPYAYVHPTFHRVLQAAGRCIRGPEDRGVIVLMDKRFGWGSYRAAYPRDFAPRNSEDTPGDVARFWAARRPPAR